MMPQGEDPIRFSQSDLTGGFRSDVTPRDMDLEFAPALNAIRFENGGIRKDFGYSRVGIPAPTRVLAIAEHKFVQDDQAFHRFIRIYRDVNGFARVEAWTGNEWVSITSQNIELRDSYVSTLSIQDKFIAADGERILYWSEENEILDVGNSFPSGELAISEGDRTTAVIDPAGAVHNEYAFHYSVEIRGASTNGVELVIGFEIGGVEVAERRYLLDATDNPEAVRKWGAEKQAVIRRVNPGEEASIVVKNVNSIGIVSSHTSEFRQETSGPATYVADKVSEGRIINNKVSFSFDVGPSELRDSPGESVTVGFYSFRDGVWHLEHDEEFADRAYMGVIREVTIPDMIAGDMFGMGIISSTDPTAFVFPYRVNWDEETARSAQVKGFSQIDDGEHGVKYQIEGNPISVFESLSPNAPGAHFVSSFAGRAVALGDGADRQSFAWSTSGNIRDWKGAGSGQIYLVESKSDPIDDLMSFASIGSSIGALFRKRSINRVVTTGNVSQALGVVEWIDGTGTESPFSVVKTPAGVFFLGHNLMVYALTEGGVRPIGRHIHRHLIANLTSNLNLVDAAYDPIFGEYILGVPERNDSKINTLWIFNVNKFILEGKEEWRMRKLNVQRLATVSAI